MKTRLQGKTSLRVLEIVMFIVFIIYFYPFFLVLINASKAPFMVTSEPLKLPSDWSLLFKNIASIWTNPNIRYPSSFLTSIIITTASLFTLNILSSQAAWVLVRTKTKFSGLIFLTFVAAMVIPFQIVMLPLVSWFRTIHNVFGLKLLRTYGGVIFAYLGFGMSLSIFLFHGFIKGIPLALEEAATIDGCGKIRTFYLIITPLLRPIHATVAILNGIWIWNDYLLPLILLGKGAGIQTFPLAVVNFAGAFVKQWDLIMAAILMAIVPIVIFFLALQRFIVKGMVAGSIK
ncbi:MAG: sugar ABC transporter permease [Spirochaeta sp. LUC14_002_19_P3]|nr:MAG: sugar ABC transporter permease [Spirochaeta sp. LUC14_002_19_P3]